MEQIIRWWCLTRGITALNRARGIVVNIATVDIIIIRINIVIIKINAIIVIIDVYASIIIQGSRRRCGCGRIQGINRILLVAAAAVSQHNATCC